MGDLADYYEGREDEDFYMELDAQDDEDESDIERTPDPARASTPKDSKGVLKESIREKILAEIGLLLQNYDNARGQKEIDQAIQAARIELEHLFTEVLTELLKEDGLACDKCRVRMEDKLRKGEL